MKIKIIIAIISLNMLLVGYIAGYYYGNKININTVFTGILKQQEEIDAAASNIKREVIYSEYVLRNADAYLPEGHLLSLGALNYVQGNVSASLYGYINEISQENMSGFTPEGILKYRAGICGSSYMVFSAIINKLGLPIRSISFFWENGNNHIVAEVYYNDGWHFYDPTWGSYFVKDGDILSAEEAFKTTNLEEYIVTNGSLLWKRVILYAFGYSNPTLRAFTDGGVTYKYDAEH